MPDSVAKHLIHKLIDWLIAFSVSILIVWFIVTQPVISKNEFKQSQAVDTDKLRKHVQLLTRGYAPRTLNYDNLNDTADYIYRELSTVGIPEYQLINTVSKQYRNVLLQLGPDTEEVYVVGAHYDAKDDSIDTEGNASGVSALIELARHLAENNNKLNIGVILVAYPISLNQSESAVNTGSYFHANSLKRQNKKVRLMLSLDSVGHLKLNTDSANKTNKLLRYLSQHKENSINVVGRLRDFGSIRALKNDFNNSSVLSLTSHNLPENFNKTHSSDHINYWKQGYPAVLISDVLPTGNTRSIATKPMSNPIDRLDYEKMANLVDGLFQVIVNTHIDKEQPHRLAQRARNNKERSLLH